MAIGWIVVFWRLGYASLLDPDEAHYAELTREMLHSGSWLVPLLDGKPFIDKPVLFHWLQGASVLLLGETEFAARLPTALSAIGLFAITRWVGAALFGEEVGSLGARHVRDDSGDVCAVVDCDLRHGVRAVSVRRRGLPARGGQAIQRPHGAVRLCAADARGDDQRAGRVGPRRPVRRRGVRRLERDRTVFRALHWKTGLPVVAIAASPWFLWMQWRFGDEFVKGYLLAGNLWYVTQPIEFSARAINHTFYIRAFTGAFFPWSIVVVGSRHRHFPPAPSERARSKAGSGCCGCGRSSSWASSASPGSSWITTSSRPLRPAA